MVMLLVSLLLLYLRIMFIINLLKSFIMATIKQGILGGFSGRVGTIVGTSWKGIAVMKSLPLSVANPKTAGQVGQRTKFSSVVALASVILSSIIKPL